MKNIVTQIYDTVYFVEFGGCVTTVAMTGATVAYIILIYLTNLLCYNKPFNVGFR